MIIALLFSSSRSNKYKHVVDRLGRKQSWKLRDRDRSVFKAGGATWKLEILALPQNRYYWVFVSFAADSKPAPLQIELSVVIPNGVKKPVKRLQKLETKATVLVFDTRF